MEEKDKTIEVMKAAMEKEKKAKEADKSADEKIEEKDDHSLSEENTTLEDNEMTKNHQEDETKDEVTTEEDIQTDSKDSEKKSDEKPSKSGKSLFKGSKNKELEAKEQKIQELSDRLMRTMAEFDNYRKRSEKEKSQMFDLGVKHVIEKMLPIIDNFERGLGSVDEANKDNPIVQGFNMIYKQLMTTMDELGVKPIEALGKEFDPNFHNAVMHGEDENLGENIVAEEFQKGYMYNDIVVRHSMVRVVN
ncbi:hypothetical protein SD1D_1034 [Herbinix luporum]|uniref:Protein GrpE n=2 Tax=Herbinix luporum TaxID=1679721 RepID=A0A0K8J526_9FIRM|nr:nucleotide exchange factor GrpE [Herbinix luporum]CUH92580.1 hypothetical protein SD1D_1034 [Herbinix luporum]